MEGQRTRKSSINIAVSALHILPAWTVDKNWLWNGILTIQSTFIKPGYFSIVTISIKTYSACQPSNDDQQCSPLIPVDSLNTSRIISSSHREHGPCAPWGVVVGGGVGGGVGIGATVAHIPQARYIVEAMLSISRQNEVYHCIFIW